MKTINLSQIRNPQESIYMERLNYQVYLGNGCRRKFRARKDAERFLAGTNKYLTNEAMAMNDDLTTVMVEYRSAWIYLRGRTTKSTAKYSELELRVGAAVVDAINSLDYIMKEHHGENHQSFIWNKFQQTGNSIISAAKDLSKFRKIRQEIYERNRLEILIATVKSRMRDLSEYGKIDNA